MSITDLLKIIISNKKTFIINCSIVTIITVLVTLFVMDEIFESVSTIKSTSKQGGLSSLLPELGGFEELTGGIGSSTAAKELALYENIIFSRRSVEDAIIRFNILEEYEFKRMDDAIKFFRNELVNISIDKLAGTMTIGVFDKSPEKAKLMNQFLIDKLNDLNIQMAVQDAKSNREFIEERYNLIKKDLTAVEDSLTMYQTKFGVSPELQIKATAESLYELEFELKSEEIKLDILNKILSSSESEIIIQEQKIQSLKDQIKKLKSSDTENYDIGLKNAPSVAMNYLRLARNVEIQNKLLTFIVPILEKSKIDENKTTPTLIVLDPPSLPDKKAKPKRSTIVIGFFILSFLLTLSYYLIRGKWSDFKKNLA